MSSIQHLAASPRLLKGELRDAEPLEEIINEDAVWRRRRFEGHVLDELTWDTGMCQQRIAGLINTRTIEEIREISILNAIRDLNGKGDACEYSQAKFYCKISHKVDENRISHSRI